MDHLDFAKTLIELSDFEGATKELISFLKVNPNDIRAWFLLADAAQEPSKKADCYRLILRLDPDNSRAQQSLRTLVAPQRQASPPPLPQSPRHPSQTSEPPNARTSHVTFSEVIAPASETQEQPSSGRRTRSRALLVFAILSAIALFVLYTLGFLPDPFLQQRMAAHEQRVAAENAAWGTVPLAALTSNPSNYDGVHVHYVGEVYYCSDDPGGLFYVRACDPGLSWPCSEPREIELFPVYHICLEGQRIEVWGHVLDSQRGFFIVPGYIEDR